MSHLERAIPEMLREQLAAHRLARPEMPRPFRKDRAEGIAFPRGPPAWTPPKAPLEQRLTVAECPIDFGQRQARPLAALPPRPARIRR